MSDIAGVLGAFAASLDLDLQADGKPGNPLVVLRLDRWLNATHEQVAGAARTTSGRCA